MRVRKLLSAAGVRVQVLCLLGSVLILLGWWFDLRQPDRIDGSAAIFFVVFLFLGLVCGPVRALREHTLWFWWSRTPQPMNDRPLSVGAPNLRPARLVWLLPVALAVPMLVLLPAWFDHHSGEWSVLADLGLIVVLCGYGGLVLSLVVWLVVLLPILLVTGLFRARPDGEGYGRMLMVGRTMLSVAATIAIAVTVRKLLG